MYKFPRKNEVEYAFLSFTKKEWLLFAIFAVTLVVSTIVILENINQSFMVSVPRRGGNVSEGVIGAPRFINPVLAISDADRDMTALVYSGLIRKNENNELVADLAENYEVSKDGLEYTFTLKEDAFFHDGEAVTADDVLFTINAIKDPLVRSPRKGNWDGVTIEKIDDRTIKFKLKQPYASFLENATVGIMPAHIWQDENVSMELNDANVNPIGSGPYEVDKVEKQSSGLIDSYELKAFKEFAAGEPYIKKITLRFYPSEEELMSALESGKVNQISSITPENAEVLAEKEYRVESAILPRIFGLFFNQNQNKLFTNKRVAQAIDLAIDKDRIVREVLNGYGVTIDNPIPPNIVVYQELKSQAALNQEERVKSAQDILAKDGWKMGPSGFLEKTVTEGKKKSTSVLEFSISTGNARELDQTAELIRQDLTAIGMKVEVKTFEIGSLNQTIIRPRKYDALLFGQIVNHESDLFAFWHSSQRKDPGLNVAMYANVQVDKLLEEAFVTTDPTQRVKKYAQFEDELKKDMPAVFLYSPDFIYAVSKDLNGLSIDHITSPGDRFREVSKWYLNTERVWKVFAPEEKQDDDNLLAAQE